MTKTGWKRFCAGRIIPFHPVFADCGKSVRHAPIGEQDTVETSRQGRKPAEQKSLAGCSDVTVQPSGFTGAKACTPASGSRRKSSVVYTPFRSALNVCHRHTAPPRDSGRLNCNRSDTVSNNLSWQDLSGYDIMSVSEREQRRSEFCLPPAADGIPAFFAGCCAGRKRASAFCRR